MIEIKSVNELLAMELNIPEYQRPYKWSVHNIQELLDDISNAISDSKRYQHQFKYRIGTIILHENEDGVLNIVDGQQRIISLVLLKRCLTQNFESNLFKIEFNNKDSQSNIWRNYCFIEDWFSFNDLKDAFEDALERILEVVVIKVDKIGEAFQLFDSQNARGKALDPHDLLKAYHLREMRDYPYEMEHAVTKWEAKKSEDIHELFDVYLFPILNWSSGNKTRSFTAKEIDVYKGISENSVYTYARRAGRAMPYFQITEPFTAGEGFFEMVDHYMLLLRNVKTEIETNPTFKDIKDILKPYRGTGFKYASDLFYCVLLCYYDKFHNFDTMAVIKMFLWAMMLRVDMRSLGFDSINRYAVGEVGYTNELAIFTKINRARLHTEISGIEILYAKKANSDNWADLLDSLRNIK